MRTFGGTTADVVVNQDTGRPATGSQLTVWTDPAGTQITELFDPDNNTLPGYVEADDVGAFKFKINSDTYDLVWVRDTSGRWWKCIADEVTIEIVQAYKQFPDLIESTNNAIAALKTITPTDAKAAGVVPETIDAATVNTELLNALLASGNVYLPAGTYYTDAAIKLPSDRTLVGAGMDLTWIKLISGVAPRVPVITNIGNTYKPHTTPDHHLRIADLSIDGAWHTRDETQTGIPNEAGCCIQLACVEHSIIERVHATNSRGHSFDISASMYRNDGPAEYADGPSRWVVVRDCVGGLSNDDAFTTHHSQYLRFDHCIAYNDGAMTSAINQNGFEVDDGSLDVDLIGCYAYGFNAGFMAKGHDDGPPTRRSSFVDCTADTNRVGFAIESIDPVTYDGSAGALPDYAVSADIQMIRCKVRNVANVTGSDSDDQMAVRLSGYANVRVKDLLIQDSPRGFIKLVNHCSRVRLDGVEFENSWTQPPSYATAKGIGAIAVGTIAGSSSAALFAGDDIEIRHVTVRDALPAGFPIISIADNAPKRLVIERVQGSGSGNGAVVMQGGEGEDWSITGIVQTGWDNDLYNTTR